MIVVYENKIWRAAIRPEYFNTLKEKELEFRVFIERQGIAKIVSLSELEIPVFPKEVKAKIIEGWELVTYTKDLIVLAYSMTRMAYDRRTDTFYKPYEWYE